MYLLYQSHLFVSISYYHNFASKLFCSGNLLHSEPRSMTSRSGLNRHFLSMSFFDCILSFVILLSLLLSFSLNPAFLALSFQLSLLSLSLPLSFSLSHCCCELPFPCAAGVVIPKSKRELLRKHLWLPTSLWLCSLPIFTTGAFEVMNEK